MRTTIFLSTLYLVFGIFACSNVERNTPAGTKPASKGVRLYALHETNMRVSTAVLRDGNCMPDAGTNTCREYLVNKMVGDYEAAGQKSTQSEGNDVYIAKRSLLPAKISNEHRKAVPAVN